MNTFVHGCSGSGKSTLARRLAAEGGLVHVDLDAFAWEPEAPTTRRSAQASIDALRAHLDGRAAVIEGMYVDLIGMLITEADTLVFLDLPVSVCLAHCRARPHEPHKFATPEAQDGWLPQLLAFVEGWPTRAGPLGRADHVALFDAHLGPKRRETEPLSTA